MEGINFVIENIGKAFAVMASFEVMPGISVLTFSVILLVINTLFDIFWFGQKSYMKASTAEEARLKTRDAHYSSKRSK